MREQEEELRRLVDEGYSNKQLCEKFDVTDGSLRFWLRKLKIKRIKKTIIRNCEECDIEMKLRLSRKSDMNRKYCSSTCSAIASNRNRERKISENNNCKICSKEIGIYSTYCGNTCYAKDKQIEVFEKIKNGDTSLYEGQYKKYLIETTGECCDKCGWSEKNERTNNIPIQLDHIDGNSENNVLDNLRLLCPNCHSLTPTYGYVKTGTGRNERQRYRNKIRHMELDELIKEKKMLDDKNKQKK